MKLKNYDEYHAEPMKFQNMSLKKFLRILRKSGPSVEVYQVLRQEMKKKDHYWSRRVSDWRMKKIPEKYKSVFFDE